MYCLNMIICPTCKKEFQIHTVTDLFSEPIIHESNKIHRFTYKNRKIYLEKLIRLVLEEEISEKDSGELEAEENPHNVACYLCGQRGRDSVICPMCNVVTCIECWDDHDELLIEIQLDNPEMKYL